MLVTYGPGLEVALHDFFLNHVPNMPYRIWHNPGLHLPSQEVEFMISRDPRAWPFLNLRVDHSAAVAPDVLGDYREGCRQGFPLRPFQLETQLARRYRA